MEHYPWWNDSQKKLADDAREFTDKVLIPIGEKMAYQKKFPWPAIREMAKKGWFGAQIPAKYGGRAEEWGVTGACIICEQAGRAGAISWTLGTTMIGGIHQLVHDGTEEQRQKWLPKIAKGELQGAITIVEPYTGSDAAEMDTIAIRDGDFYIINGKKRFQSSGGTAGIYMTYVRTSSKPEDQAKYKHLSGFIIERGTPGFHVEKVNDVIAMDGVHHTYLSFNDVKVPVSNRIGMEGDGWAVMMSGLNVERLIQAIGPISFMIEVLRYAMLHLDRRIQFGQRTGDMVSNQFKIADIITSLKVAREYSYYTAYLADLGRDMQVEASIAKLFNTDLGLQAVIEGIQLMGGNGVSRFYPLERYLRDTKTMQIAAGTQEIQRLLIYRQGIKSLSSDIKPLYRAIDPELNVPLPAASPPIPKQINGELDILKVLAENYRVNPGLHMTMDDIKEVLSVNDADLIMHLLSLEKKSLTSLYRDRKNRIALARATYKGLNEANPPEYYKYFPSWVDPKDIF